MTKVARLPSRFDVGVFILFMVTVFLQAVYVSIVPLPILSIVPLCILWFRRGVIRSEVNVLYLIIMYILCMVVLSVDKGWDPHHVYRSALGSFLFLCTTLMLPRILLWMGQKGRLAATLAYALFTVSLLLDLKGIVNFRALGVTNGGDVQQLEESVIRPSGLAGEPSWFSLIMLTLTLYIMTFKRPANAYAAATAVLVLLSRSSAGVVGLGILAISWWNAFAKRTLNKVNNKYIKYALQASMLVIFFYICLALLFIVIEYSDDGGVIAKILSPTKYQSGINRFQAPLEYISLTFEKNPLTGFGYTYYSEVLAGRTGSAVLPFPVFWESGLIGIAAYYSLFGYLIYLFRPRFRDLLLFVLINISLGTPYSPFQAILIVIPLIARKLEEASKVRHA